MPVNTILETIENPAIKELANQICQHLADKYPEFVGEIKWKKLMYSKDGSFFIGLDAAKKHLSIVPEPYALEQFATAIKEAGYASTKSIFKIGEEQTVDFALLDDLIAFKVADKEGATSYFK
jgi:uncharacterized protein YdhG (YjbR/CyaY superfamily)